MSRSGALVMARMRRTFPRFTRGELSEAPLKQVLDVHGRDQSSLQCLSGAILVEDLLDGRTFRHDVEDVNVVFLAFCVYQRRLGFEADDSHMFGYAGRSALSR